MSDIASLEMLLRHLIVALPVLVLIVLFFLLALGRRSEPPADRQDQLHRDPGGPVASIPAARSSSSSGADGAVGSQHPGGSLAHQAMLSTALLTAPPPEPETAPANREAGIARLQEAIAAADDAGETVRLAELHFELGRLLLENGDEAQGLDSFRSAAGLAALHKVPRLHAQARLELAEAAIRHGDPTTACEHWQMARMAFLDAKSKLEGDKIDRLMRANGCPTDWVLTDF